MRICDAVRQLCDAARQLCDAFRLRSQTMLAVPCRTMPLAHPCSVGLDFRVVEMENHMRKFNRHSAAATATTAAAAATFVLSVCVSFAEPAPSAKEDSVNGRGTLAEGLEK